MTEVKEQFKEAASKQTTTLGWKFIFDKYDDDGSGELDIEEFRQCVRHECKLTQEECSDDDVVELFCIVDATSPARSTPPSCAPSSRRTSRRPP